MPDPPQFELTSERESDRVVVRVSGELDLATAPRLDDALAAVDGPVVLDLSQLSFMDSQGLRILLAWDRRAAEAGVEHAVVAPTGPVAALMEMSGAGRRLPLVSSAGGADDRTR